VVIEMESISLLLGEAPCVIAALRNAAQDKILASRN